MTRFKNTKLTAGWAVPALLLGLLACSTDSPTAPKQQPVPPGGGGASAVWAIGVSVSPDSLAALAANPATVAVDVRRADNNAPPANGTTMVLSTSLGDFNGSASGVKSVVLTTVNGKAQAQLFTGSITGIAVVTAQLEGSAGQGTLEVTVPLPDLIAAFSFQDTTDNLSIQFLNESQGDPDKFRWDFGDGKTSKEEHPSHIYAAPGDYPVELTVFRGNESSKRAEIVRASQEVFITDVDPMVVKEGGRLRIKGQGFDTAVRVLLENVLVNLVSKSPTQLLIDVPFLLPFPLEPCDSNGDLVNDGVIRAPITPLNITVEVSGSISSDSVEVAGTILPDRPRCTPTEGDPIFVTDVTPNAGPASGGQIVTITGSGFFGDLRVFFGGVLAETVSSTSTRIVVITPPGVLGTVACDDDGDTIVGERAADTLTPILIELSTGPTHIVNGGYTYLAPLGAPCNGD